MASTIGSKRSLLDGCLKFKGIDESEQAEVQKQLGMLNSEQQEIWSKPRVMVEPFRVSSEKADNLQKQIDDLIQTNLLPHTNELRVKYAPAMTGLNTEELSKLVLRWRSTPQTLMAEIKIKFGEIPPPIIFAGLLSKFEEPRTQPAREELLQFVAIMEYLLRTNFDLVDPLGREDLSADLQGLRSLLKNEIQGTTSNRFLVLTTLNSDPKFLLTVGDVVKTPSCQNYRTGGKIETLLGYVLDAHIQALASFTLEPENFATTSDFNLVYAAYSSSQAAPTVEFNGDRRVASFELPSGQKINSVPLSQAYLRRVLKLGRTSKGRPALFLEREYLQNHRALSQMREQLKTLKETLQQELDADSTAEAIEISGSRNALGHYSDAAGGAQFTSYILKNKFIHFSR